MSSQTVEVSDVFGVRPSVSQYTYVDRGNLDTRLKVYLRDHLHLAISGDSKTGKSWLRQKIFDNPLVYQARLRHETTDIYKEALRQLGIQLIIKETENGTKNYEFAATGEHGTSLLAKISAKLKLGYSASRSVEKQVIGEEVDNLQFICEALKQSGRRLVIEDFHYLSEDVRTDLAHDLKTMWDYECFVTIVGIWSDDNLLHRLNSDLTERTKELTIKWSPEDLKQIVVKGGEVLNVSFSDKVTNFLVEISYGNAGLLQALLKELLYFHQVYETQKAEKLIDNYDDVESVALAHADGLNTRYQDFAEKVNRGIRKRENSTDIYAHALAEIFGASDSELISGVDRNDIYNQAHARQPRIQKGNLRTALENFERLQVDENGKGLVLAYSNDKVRCVDSQLLFYRRFSTVQWPWEEIIQEARK